MRLKKSEEKKVTYSLNCVFVRAKKRKQKKVDKKREKSNVKGNINVLNTEK